MFFNTERKHIFISHAWKYNDDYYTIIDWLNHSSIVYHNYSVPEHDPLDAGNTSKLKSALTEQMKHANIVIIIAGLYTNHSDWIKYEIDESKRMNKKIIAIKPRGNVNLPFQVQDAANKIVNWNRNALIEAIKAI